MREILILKPTHLYRRCIFDFARIKHEDLFEVVACNNESRNALAHKSNAFMGPNKMPEQN
jgi:hypothetical protein